MMNLIIDEKIFNHSNLLFTASEKIGFIVFDGIIVILTSTVFEKLRLGEIHLVLSFLLDNILNPPLTMCMISPWP